VQGRQHYEDAIDDIVLCASGPIEVRYHMAWSRETRMTHATRFVAVAVLVALAVGAPVQAQTPEIDALGARAETGGAETLIRLGAMYQECG